MAALPRWRGSAASCERTQPRFLVASLARFSYQTAHWQNSAPLFFSPISCYLAHQLTRHVEPRLEYWHQRTQSLADLSKNTCLLSVFRPIIWLCFPSSFPLEINMPLTLLSGDICACGDNLACWILHYRESGQITQQTAKKQPQTLHLCPRPFNYNDSVRVHVVIIASLAAFVEPVWVCHATGERGQTLVQNVNICGGQEPNGCRTDPWEQRVIGSNSWTTVLGRGAWKRHNNFHINTADEGTTSPLWIKSARPVPDCGLCFGRMWQLPNARCFLYSISDCHCGKRDENKSEAATGRLLGETICVSL